MLAQEKGLPAPAKKGVGLSKLRSMTSPLYEGPVTVSGKGGGTDEKGEEDDEAYGIWNQLAYRNCAIVDVCCVVWSSTLFNCLTGLGMDVLFKEKGKK